MSHVPFLTSSPGDSRDSQHLLRAFVRHLPAAVAMLDRELRYLQTSERWCAEYGLDFNQLPGRSHYEVFPEIPERWKELHRRALSGETVKSDEDCFEHNGRRTWLRWEIRPWGNDGNRPEGILIFTEDITERKNAREALRDQLDRLEKIVATVPGAICAFRLDADGAVSVPYASPGFRAMLPELPDLRKDARPFFAMMHPADAERVRAAIAVSARTLMPWRDSYRIQTPGRGEIWLEGHSIPTWQSDGSVIWYGYLSDVTERKRMVQALEVARQEYRDLVDNSPDAVARLDPQGRYLFVNAHILKITGRREEDFIGKRADEAGLPASIARKVLRLVDRVVTTGQREEAGFSLRLGGIRRYWQTRLIPEFDAGRSGIFSSTVGSVLLISIDVTERRRAEEEARRNAEEARERDAVIRALFDTASQAILGVDAEGGIRLANRMSAELFGYALDELPGKKLETLLPARLRERHAASRAAFALDPKNRPMGQGMELVGRRADGSEFPIEVSLSYLNTSRGLLAVGFVTDITVRKRNENALRENAAELRKLSLALIAAEEETASQIARELHDDITQKLAFLSMEIGKTAAQPLPAGDLARELRAFQTRILDISEDIRRISHLMHPSIVDDLGLEAAIEAMCEDFARVEGIPVRFAARGVPHDIARGVAFCLYRVAQESLRNVSKHAKAADAAVTLSCGNGVLELSVADSGIGFDTAARKGGLGTHSMLERVRLVKGDLSVRSSAGKGTRVVARIPCGEE